MGTWTKYPRTYHLPWSPGATSDDKVHSESAIAVMFGGQQVVVTEKMDGENTTIYSDGHCHARSLDSKGHPSRDYVRSLAGRIHRDIPDGFRICGENLFAQHSLPYDTLPDYFLVFGMYDANNTCLSWEDTVEYAAMLGLHTVPVLAQGKWEDLNLTVPPKSTYGGEAEGYVVRLARSFAFDAFKSSVAKYVRPNHVQTDTHWMHQKINPNKLAP